MMRKSRFSLHSARRNIAAIFAISLLCVAATPASAQERAAVQSIAITARPISSFELASSTTTFGQLEFVGGLELTSDAPDFGALSAFRFRDAGKDFVGVADTGFWFFGAMSRDHSGKPTGMTTFHMAQMTDARGRPVDEKWEVDAEGLALRDKELAVGFERKHRIGRYDIQGEAINHQGEYDFLVPANELRQNRGFEAIDFAPLDSINQGALVAVSEKSLDKAGNIFAAVLAGPNKGIFTIKRSDAFDITDSAFLPNGDLLLLERSFSMASGVGMRLRRLAAADVKGGAVAVDGPILMQANMSYQIDNMEAMDVWTRMDGATIISLMSDDNHSMLQRNLYLEFRLQDGKV